MPQTHYRIVDLETDTIVASGITEYAHAHEIYDMYKLDYPNTDFEIESYTHYTVKGLGRDPDLHWHAR